MRTRVFSPTYPTWALVGETSRPAGETVSVRLEAGIFQFEVFLIIISLFDEETLLFFIVLRNK